MRWVSVGLLGCCVACVAGDSVARTGDSAGTVDSVDSGDTAGDSGGGVVDRHLVVGPELACAAPLATPSWTDVAGQLGLVGRPAGQVGHSAGGFAALAELDGVPGLDIAIDVLGETQFYLRSGDAYTLSRVPNTDTARLAALDPEGDGVDAVLRGGAPITRWTWRAGSPTSEVAIPSLPDGDYGAGGVYVGDMQGDGVADLFAMAGRPELADRLFDGLGGTGGFAEDAGAYPSFFAAGLGFDATWFDYQADGDLDIYVSNAQGTIYGVNELSINDGTGKFTAAPASGGCVPTISGMGQDVGDFNGDGLPDLYLTESANHRVLEALPDGSCIDVGQAAGLPVLDQAAMGWGGIFADLDNDTDLDVLEAQGDLWSDPTDTYRIRDWPFQVFLNDGGALSESSTALGLDAQGSWRAVIAWDDNDDGVLDVLVTDVEAAPRLYLSDGCTSNAWIEVAGPVGAKVEVTVGEQTQTSWVTAQSGMGGSRPLFVHVGLGDVDDVDQVRVTALDGTVWTSGGRMAARRRFWVPGGPDPWLSRPTP